MHLISYIPQSFFVNITQLPAVMFEWSQQSLPSKKRRGICIARSIYYPLIL